MTEPKAPAKPTKAQPDQPDQSDQPAKGNGVPWQWLFAVAAILALIYIVLSFKAYDRADDPGITEPIWARSSAVLQGFEAIAFTAIGWLFGREVHRGEAKAAQEQAKTAKESADDAKVDAKEAREESAAARESERDAASRAASAETNGWRLAEAVRAESAPPRSRDRGIDGDGGNENSPADDTGGPGHSARVRELADRLFPPN